MVDKTIKERHARLKERDKERDWISLRVRIPRSDRAEVVALCAAKRKAKPG